MAINIGSNFNYNGKLPNFERDSFETLLDMRSYSEQSIDEGHISYCKETNKHYKFNSNNDIDSTLGKWREFNNSIIDEKVKMDNTTNAKYLSELIDKVTIQVENESLVVKTIDGLTVTTTELNTLKGMTENVKSMFSSIGTGGMAFKGTKNTKADLDSIISPSNGDMYIVITDESSDNKIDTVTYVYSDIDTSWLKIGLTNIVVRDFATNPIDLSSEVTGKLPIEKVETGTLATKDDLKNYYSKDDIDGNSFASKNDLTKYYTKTDMNTELLSYAKSTDLTTHANDTVLHITSAERTKWNSYKEFSGDYADLRNKPDIPTVSNDLTDALKQSYDDAVIKSHEHNNKADVLDKLSTSNGKLLFNGKEISSSSTQVISDNIFTDDWKATTSYKIDDVVKYKYKDYKCTTAHTSTDTFDDTKWEFVKYSELHVYSVSKSEYDLLVTNGIITDDTKDLYVIDGTSSGGGSSSGGDSEAVWGSITGTLTEQVDLKNVLDGKADMSHTHVVADITDFPTSLPANGGNADTLNGKSDTDFADVNHTHTEINGHTIESDVPADAVFTDTVLEMNDADISKTKTWSSDKITTEINKAVADSEVDLAPYQKKTDDILSTIDKTITGSINEIKTTVDTHIDNSDIHVTAEDKTKWNAYKEFSGDYTDLTNKPEIPTSLPANGGNSDTVNNHTVKSDVPSDAVFTDTIYDDKDIKYTIGKNLFGTSWEDGDISTSGVLSDSTTVCRSGFIRIYDVRGLNYYFTIYGYNGDGSNSIRVIYYDKSKKPIASEDALKKSTSPNRIDTIYIDGSTTRYVRLVLNKSSLGTTSKFQFEPHESTLYVAYSGILDQDSNIDDSITSSDKTWSSQKINNTIPSKLSSLKDDSYSHGGIGTSKAIIDYKYPSDGPICISSDPGLNVCEGIAVFQDSDGENNYTINKVPVSTVQNHLGIGSPTIELIAGTENNMQSYGIYAIKYGKCVNIIIGHNYRWKQYSNTTTNMSAIVTIPKKYAPSSIYNTISFPVAVLNGLDNYDEYNAYITITRNSDGTANMRLSTLVSTIDSEYGVAVYGGSTTYFTD